MKLIRKNIKLITIIVFILIITGIFILKKMLVKSASIEENLLANEELEIKEEPDIIHEEVSEVKPLNYVDIKGEVINPGVYEITPNMRVQEVINQAGGLTENADTSLINLAKKVTDQMVIIIFNKEQVIARENKNKIIDEEIIVDSEIALQEDKKEEPSTNKDDQNSSELVSLNDATKEELIKVPGIGESKASAIIEYRLKQKFTQVEDLLQVNGIGNTVYEKIKIYFKV